jgi:predicted transcriptional regulator
MENGNQLDSMQEVEKQLSLADLLGKLEETCKNCNPLTPISCVSACKTWRLKNQFRRLHEKAKNPYFMTRLLNTLKNERRLQVLATISKEKYSITRLQQKLKTLGFNHSQQTIAEEYINPLVEVGLAEEGQNFYHATIFGCKLSEILRDSNDFGQLLPSHSECYEEITLDVLAQGPKTYENLKCAIPAKSVARVLNRLERATLVEKSKEKDYIFFFRTKRDPNGSGQLSPTERRTYENILPDGISARNLADKTRISLRRTYKYLRKLKGKKLVFIRKKPMSYALTARGLQMATVLKALRNLAVEALAATAKLAWIAETNETLTPESHPALKKKQGEEIIPLTAIQRVGPN